MSLVRRVLFVAWQDPVTRRLFPVARLLDREREPRWEFAYIRGAQLAAERGFTHFLGMDDPETVYESAELPPLFQNRLMRPKRPDYPEYMRHLGLSEDTRDEIPILARSEGRRATDTIEVFGLPTFDGERNVYRFYFFARGIRHVEGAEDRIARLRTGTELYLHPDPDNPADCLAIEVRSDRGGLVGFVPNTLVEDLRDMRDLHCPLDVFVHQVNPVPAPVQLRLLCRLEARALPSYTPFSGARYHPLSSQATKIDIRPRELVG